MCGGCVFPSDWFMTLRRYGVIFNKKCMAWALEVNDAAAYCICLLRHVWRRPDFNTQQKNVVNELIFKAICLISEKAEMCLHMQNMHMNKNKHEHMLMMVCTLLACPPRPLCLFTPLKMYYCIWADIFLDLREKFSWRHCFAYWMLRQLLLLSQA